MSMNGLPQGEKYIRNHRFHKRWHKVLMCLSSIVAFCTICALILPAITMERTCPIPEHIHTDACYTKVSSVQKVIPICTPKTLNVHQHTSDCYGADGEVNCGYADFVVHTHDAECYDENGELWCPLPEIATHEHTDACYAQAGGELICGHDETDGSTGHTHDESCYGEDGKLQCSLPESEAVEEHHHTDACYAEGRGELACGKTEVILHRHVAACYDENGSLICGKMQVLQHRHSDACFRKTEVSADIDRLTCTNTDEHHVHTDRCYGTWVLSCGLEEHTHTKSCYTQQTREPLSGKEEHTHNDACYDESGTLICGFEEHTHTESCHDAAGSTQEFTYTDSELSMRVTVKSPAPLAERTELSVQPADDLRQTRADIQDGAEQWIVRQIALTHAGKALDTSGMTMTAEITVQKNVLAPLYSSLTEQAEAAPEAAPEADAGITLAVMQKNGTQALQELKSVTIAPDEDMPVIHAEIRSGTIAVLATTANPHYQVQYYAYIPRFSTSGNNALKVFDTSGGVLPKNNQTNKTKEIYLEPAGGTTNKNAGNATELYRVKTENVLTKMYTPNEFEYIKAPNPSYINKLSENSNYTLKEIWVLRSGKDADSTNPADWEVYGTDIHFTNRSGITGHNLIYITDNTVIRMIYDCDTSSQSLPATFYDYDITNGMNSSGRWMSGTTGINIPANYGTSRNGQRTWTSYRDVLAFGNDNCGTGMSRYIFDGVFLNKYSTRYLNGGISTPVSNFDQFGCTFELVESLDSDGNIVYNPWLVAPKLFSDGSANGKHTYSGSSLTFSQVGDTYTLSSATVSSVGSIDQLDRFFHPSPRATTTYTNIFTNDFWPLDAASNRTDPLFGGSTSVPFAGFTPDGVVNADGSQKTNPAFAGSNGSFPASDDGQAHNSFFGMQYAMEFTLAEDYVGPLEYYFFGDDDMWVFLDGRLVCDIGGVHTSVGEYVDLWDYLEKGKSGAHTLSFFYTERGASGSTCYMSFTLPSVSGINIEQKTGNLTVKKEVIGVEDAAKNFEFSIRFYDQNGNTVLDDYSYNKTDAAGAVSNDLILHEGSTFTLKAGEQIEIKYLPIGMRYQITEQNSGGYSVTNTVNGAISSGTTAVGTVIKDSLNQVVFTNTLDSVGLVMQKVDQDGNPLSGAAFRLKNSKGEIMNFVQTDEGVYAVPSGGTSYLQLSTAEQQGAAYYIASAADQSFVLAQDLSSPYRARIRKKDGSSAQKVYIYRQADGSYSFRSALNDKWLDLDNGRPDNGTAVHFWENGSVPTAHDNQKWYLIVNDDGSFKIKPRVAVLHKDKAVMDLNAANLSPGEVIQAWTDNGSNAQKWLLVPVDPAKAPTTVTELTCGENAVLRISGLLPGTYTLVETNAPADYQNSLGDVELRVKADGSVEKLGANSLVTTESSGGNMVVKVMNRRTDRSLTLEKQVVHSDTTQAFPFTITYINADGKVITAASPKLSGGASSGPVTIPYGVMVTIREEKHDGFALTFYNGGTLLESDGDSCTFRMTENITIKAVNTAGYALPSTGGGVVWYRLTGLLLLMTAGLLYILCLRRRRERGPK